MPEILNRYNRWLTVRQYSPATVKIYLYRIEKFIKVYPEEALPRITKQDLQQYLLDLSRSISFETMGGLFSTLNNFFKFLRIDGYEMPFLQENPIKDFAPIKRAKNTPRIIPSDELSRIMRAPKLKTVRGMRDYMIMMCLLHGLRAAEICNLDIKDIYSDGWGSARRLVIHVRGKGRRERNIIAERSGDLEWAWEKWREKRGIIECHALFPSYRGVRAIGRMTTNGLYRLLKRYGDKIGIKGVHPHAWRHTAAVQLIEEGIDIKEIQVRLGHESVATTEKYTAGASILQEGAANSQWIHQLKKADLRHRRQRRS